MIAVVPSTVKVRRLLAEEGTGLQEAVLRGAKALEALLDDGRVLAVVVGVHLHVTGADVHLITASLQAVVVRLLAVVRTGAEALHAVVRRAAAEEAVRQRLVALLVPLEVADHLLLLHEDPGVAGGGVAVKVLAVVQLAAEGVAALRRVAVPEIEVQMRRLGLKDDLNSFLCLHLPFDVVGVVNLHRIVDQFI